MESDFWVLMTGLANQLDRRGSTPGERHDQLITSFRRLSDPTRAAMLRRMRFVASMLAEVIARAEGESESPSPGASCVPRSCNRRAPMTDALPWLSKGKHNARMQAGTRLEANAMGSCINFWSELHVLTRAIESQGSGPSARINAIAKAFDDLAPAAKAEVRTDLSFALSELRALQAHIMVASAAARRQLTA
jgi:hypothetical protein